MIPPQRNSAIDLVALALLIYTAAFFSIFEFFFYKIFTMTDNLYESDVEQVIMLNGRSVMNALAFLNSEATENELLECFSASNLDARDLVQQELKRTLDNAVTNGFITRNDGKYSVPGLGKMYQVDGDISSDDDEPFTGFDKTDVAKARGAVVAAHKATGACEKTCSTSTATKRSRDASDAVSSTKVTVTITTYVVYSLLFRVDESVS